MYIIIKEHKLSDSDPIGEYTNYPESGLFKVFRNSYEPIIVYVNHEIKIACLVDVCSMIPEGIIIDSDNQDIKQKIPNGIISEPNHFETKFGQVFTELPIESSVSFLHDGKVSEDFVLKMCDLFLNGSKKSIQRGANEINKIKLS